MPPSRKINKTILRQIARRVSEKLSPPTMFEAAEFSTGELAEAFEMWFLGRIAIVRPDMPLSKLARHTGLWYHQLRIGGQARKYVISQPRGPSALDWEVHAVMSSDLPEAMDDAIQWIDAQHLDGELTARLLFAPAYHLTAFWLEHRRSSSVVVIEEPEWFQHLKKRTIYSERDFLTALGREKTVHAIPRRPVPTIPLNIEK